MSAELIRTKNGFVTTEATSRAKRAVRGSDTKPELVLRRELWARGHRYRKNLGSLPGKPDLAFLKKRVAVFVDGDFWHGRNWTDRRSRLKRNRDYWIQKIESNMARDKRVISELERSGWTVVRLWSTDVLKDVASAVGAVESALTRRD